MFTPYKFAFVSANIELNMVSGLIPQACWVRLEAMEQAGEGIMCGCVHAIGLHASRFQATIRFRRSYQEVDIVEFVGFRMVHSISVAHSALTA